MKNLLDSLREHTIVVADTGDFQSIQTFRPTDATTNPSLILKAVQQEKYQSLVNKVIAQHPHAELHTLTDALLVEFGCEILDIVPGRVSTEVDARLSFNTQATIARARKLINDYEQRGIAKERILIKIAATWEGIQAAKQLEEEGIHCNITLLFSLEQGVAAANAGVQLISPFVGRIYDWYKNQAGETWNEQQQAGINDPGVQSVTNIYHYYKAHAIQTEVMGASFRNKEQIIALAGCDLLTISPNLLEELGNTPGEVTPYLKEARPSPAIIEVNADNFETLLKGNTMAYEKLHEGIEAFVKDAETLDALLLKAQHNHKILKQQHSR